MSTLIFPQDNLSNSQRPWARTLESAAIENSSTLDRLKLAVNADNRARSAQMNTVGRNITSLQDATQELQARNTVELTIASATTTISAPTLNATYNYNTSVTLNFPGTLDGNTRNGTLFLSFQAYNSQSASSFGDVSVRTNGLGNELYSEALANPRTASSPPSWTEATTFSGPLVSSSPTFNLNISGRVSRWTGTNTSVTVGVVNIRAIILFGDRAYG